MKEKLFIAFKNVSNKGKTSTIKDIAKLLVEEYNIKNDSINNYDIEIKLEINGTNLAIISQGDPSTNLKNKLNKIINENDVIICATRTSGETVEAVNSISKEHNAKVIWTSTYSTNTKDKQFLDNINKIKAKHIVDLLKNLGYI